MQGKVRYHPILNRAEPPVSCPETLSKSDRPELNRPVNIVERGVHLLPGQ